MSQLRAKAYSRAVTIAGGLSGTKTDDVFIEAPFRAWAGTPVSPLVIVHGAGFITPWMTNEPNTPNYCKMTHELAKNFSVYVADFGGDWWGSPDHIARIDEGRAELNAQMGTSDPITLVGFSMGGLGALNYAKANPSRVRALALIFPVIDLALFESTFDPGGTVIDPCYSGGYTDVTYGANHNPKIWASTLSSGIPVKIYYSTADTTIPAATITAFQAARPSTKISMVGANGHTDATVGDALPDLLRFCKILV